MGLGSSAKNIFKFKSSSQVKKRLEHKIEESTAGKNFSKFPYACMCKKTLSPGKIYGLRADAAEHSGKLGHNRFARRQCQVL